MDQIGRWDHQEMTCKEKKISLIFYEQAMVAAVKIHQVHGKQIKNIGFIIGLKKQFEVYINILLSDTLQEALASQGKLRY